MADSPEIAEAKDKLRELVVPAVETLGELIDSEHAGIRLGASKEVLDRGGLPTRRDVHQHVDLTLDEEIESLIRSVRRQVEHRSSLTGEGLDIEDAIVIEDEGPLPLGEQAADQIGLPFAATTEEDEEEDVPNAWWQARPDNVVD